MKTIVTLALPILLATTGWSGRAAELSLDSAPPVVVKTVPASGATDADPALTEIKVTFSKIMQDGSWSWSTWGEENYPETTGQPKYLSDGRTCVLPVKLQPNRFYAIWLNSEKFRNFRDASGRSAVPYLLTFTTGSGGSGDPVTERELGKLVREFPPTEDLATPEGACVAWQRANARKDATAVSRLSLVPLNVKEHEAWLQREEKRDPEGLAIYLKAIAESKVITVQSWRGDLANVITLLPFPEGKGRSPYSARVFGRVNGVWKNLGEDRLPDLASAKANFVRKKAAIWQQFQELKSNSASASGPKPGLPSDELLNEDQRAVLAWTDRQFRKFFDNRNFAQLSAEERAAQEARLIEALKGPQTPEYFLAINTLAALRSGAALPELRRIAFERVDRNNRDRWMCVRALGLIGDMTAVPDLIHLVYHGNPNTRWWAQISLVRITGQNFGRDWNAWAKWWSGQKLPPPYQPEIIRWWDGQAEPDQLAIKLAEADQKFLADIKPKSEATTAVPESELATRLRSAKPTMDAIREHWSATAMALDSGDHAAALAAAKKLAPSIQEFRDKFRLTALEAGPTKAVDLLKTLTTALEKQDAAGIESARAAMQTLGRSMEEQIRAIAATGEASAAR